MTGIDKHHSTTDFDATAHFNGRAITSDACVAQLALSIQEAISFASFPTAKPDMDDFEIECGEEEKRLSALVAPLNIHKSPKRARSRDARHKRQSSSRGAVSVRSQPRSHSQPSPPLTPKTSRESVPEREPSLPLFHNYLRAFCKFNPETTITSSSDESSITVPIRQGDVILVHSVHPNGWADGTVLSTGSRGWLPTNYCEAFDHAAIYKLLLALTQLWDLVREGEFSGDHGVFKKQDYVRAMIAGVRYFLVSLPSDMCPTYSWLTLYRRRHSV